MGFWNKLKQAKNYLTGGGLDAHIRFTDEPRLKQPFMVELNAVIEDHDIEVREINLIIRNIETVKVRVTGNQRSTRDNQVINTSRDETETNVLCEDKIVVTQHTLLEANRKYNWNVQVHLPERGNPNYQSENCKIYWTMQAFFEKGGNDPNTDLVYFEPAYTIS